MASAFDDRQSNMEAVAVREPLVDISTGPSLPTETKPQIKLGHKQLSVSDSPLDASPAEPKPQRRRVSVAQENDRPEPAPASQAPSGRPRVVRARVEISPPKPIENPGPSRMDDGMPVSAEPQTIDPAEAARHVAKLRNKQSLPFAAVAGLLAAVIAAVLWAAAAAAVGLQIAWMAAVTAILVGAVVRTLGRGLDRSFGWLGVGLSLFGCILGNYLAGCVSIAQEAGLPVAGVLAQAHSISVFGLMASVLSPLDILFYGLAVLVGYRLSFQPVVRPQPCNIRA